jgi:hypothetical protein
MYSGLMISGPSLDSEWKREARNSSTNRISVRTEQLRDRSSLRRLLGAPDLTQRYQARSDRTVCEIDRFEGNIGAVFKLAAGRGAPA